MLNAENLANSLKAAVSGSTEAADAHSKFTNALLNYIQANLIVKGTYNGLLPTTPPTPDPKNGNYEWQPTTVTINASSLQAAAAGSFNAWTDAMKAALNLTVVVGVDKVNMITTLAPSSLLVSNFTIDMSSKPDTMEKAYVKLGEGIVNSILSATMNPISVPAQSTGGTGTVVFTGVE